LLRVHPEPVRGPGGPGVDRMALRCDNRGCLTPLSATRKSHPRNDLPGEPVDLFIVRHAIAVERGDSAYPWDDDRPLTPEGIHKFRLAAKGLERLDVRPQRILSSPLIRARQTAEILRDALSPELEIEYSEKLKPDSEFGDTLGAVAALGSKSVAVVGHEPHLSAFASYLLCGPGHSASLVLRKGATARISFPAEPAPGLGFLEWLLQPGALRRIAET
jgi:phosphohistidine phosphatase